MFEFATFDAPLLRWLPVAAVPVLAVVTHRAARGGRWKTVATVVTVATVALATVVNGATIARQIARPPDFDFRLYWIYGRVAAEGLSPYDPANLKGVADHVDLGRTARDELFFFQTPPTLLVFAPLGHLDLDVACVAWFIVQIGMLPVAVLLLARQFLSENESGGIAFVAALLLLLPATEGTFRVAQVNFLLLVTLVLFLRNASGLSGGAWLAAGVLLKPVLFLLPPYLVLRGRWKPAGGGILAVAGLSLATVAFFGLDTFLGFFTTSPLGRVPDTLYTEWINQSLLAEALRRTDFTFGSGSPYFQPGFLVPAALLTTVTAVQLARSPANCDWCHATLVVLGLLLFPKTLAHYAVLLIVPILLLWKHRQQLPGGLTTTILLVTPMYAALAMHRAFHAHLFCWLVLVVGRHWLVDEERSPESDALAPPARRPPRPQPVHSPSVPATHVS